MTRLDPHSILFAPILKGSVSLLAPLTAWVETGQLKPVIDRTYPLEQIAAAHRYVEQRHKKGNVIVTIPQET